MVWKSVRKAGALASSFGFCFAAGLGAANANEVVFGCFGGAVQANYENFIIPEFEREHNVTVRYIPGVSTHFVSQLQAQRAHPEFDLVCMDNGPQAIARELGVLDTIDVATVPNYADVIDQARMPGDTGVGYGLLSIGFVYSPEMFQNADVEPPASWADLADPRLNGLLGMPSVGTSPGLYTLIMMARGNGGDEENIDPGFEKMKEVAQNVALFSASSDLSQRLQQGEVGMSVWTNGETARFVNRTGFPLEFVYPEEGSPFVMPTLNLVRDRPNGKNADLLMNHIISKDVQRILVRESRVGPVNGKVELSAEEADGVIYGPEARARLLYMNWPVINENRATWTDRWNREVER